MVYIKKFFLINYFLKNNNKEYLCWQCSENGPDTQAVKANSWILFTFLMFGQAAPSQLLVFQASVSEQTFLIALFKRSTSKMCSKDVSWKMDYCCLNAHLPKSSKELLVSVYIYIRFICITTIALSMPLFFFPPVKFLNLFATFLKTSALSLRGC